MKSMIIGGIITVIALMTGTYFMAGDAFQSDDYVNSLTMIGAISIIAITIATALKYVNQIKNDKADGDLADGKWDGIGEYLNPIPSGWGLLFIGTIIYMLWYMFIGYPTNQFSQIGQYNEEVIEINKKFKKQWTNPSQNTLNKMGQSIFLVQCAPCHGIIGDGINGKSQNLTHRMSEEQILDVIKNGSKGLGYPMGAMPGGMAQGDEAKKIATYIYSGMKGKVPSSYGVCAGCHGMDGKGNNGSAPNIAEYDDLLVSKILEKGKKGYIGEMPSFKGRLNNIQIKSLSNYLRTIQEGE